MRRTLLTLSVIVLLVVTMMLPAAAAPRPSFEVDEGALAGLLDEIDAAGVTTYDGRLAGAAWVAQVPDDWNGELVVWAHGFRGEGPALTVDPPAAYEWLLDEGYAWAASSYRRNSYDPGIGVIDTMKVTRKVENLLGGADRTYLAGVSMGGHVTAAAIERYPDLWDGALPACGVLGDVELFDYFLDYNVGAAAFAGLDGDDLVYPSTSWIADTVDPAIKPELSLYDEFGLPDDLWALDGGLPGNPDLLTGPGQDFKDFVEVGSGGERVTFDAAWDFWHLPVDALDNGDFFFLLGEGDGTIANRRGVVSRNSDTSYAEEYAPSDGGIDELVARVDADNRVRRAQGTKPAPIIAGDPDVPVLTMHTTGDLFVPIEMEQIYAEEVAANGKQDLLVQRAVRDVGHCTFTESEWIRSYTDLVDWVATGIRPAGEDLVDGIGDPLLGCAWTVDDGTGGTDLRPLFACP